MKNLSYLLIGFLTLSPVFATGTVLPLSSNSWNNPQFVNRFLGTYGIDSQKEPQITQVESELLQSVITAARNGDFPGALVALQAGMIEDYSAAFDFIAANLNFQLGNLEVAEANYKTAIKRFPEFRRAYENLGRLSVQLGNYEDAAKYILAAMELGSNSSDLFGLLAFCYLNEGNALSALDAYRLASAMDPSNKDWKVGKAQAYLQTEQYANAIALFGELLEKDPTNERFITALSNAYLGLGDHVKSSRALELLRRLEKADGNALKLLGDIYLNENLPNLALGPYLEARNSLKPLDVKTQIKIASILLLRNGLKEAKDMVTMIEKDSPSLDDATRLELLLVKSTIAQNSGEMEGAAAILQDIIDLDPVYGPGLLQLGSMNYDKGDYEESIYYYERASKLSDSEQAALIGLARAHVALRDYGEAVKVLRKSVALNPNENIRNYLNAVERAFERENF